MKERNGKLDSRFRGSRNNNKLGKIIISSSVMPSVVSLPLFIQTEREKLKSKCIFEKVCSEVFLLVILEMKERTKDERRVKERKGEKISSPDSQR